jgi:hypothetical protein
MVFERKTLGSINLFKRTATGDYLLAGLDSYHIMHFYLLSSSGKTKWHHQIGAGFYIDAIMTKENGIIITHHQGDTGKLLCMDNNGKINLKKQIFFHALIPSIRGFIGVKNGTITALDMHGSLLWERVIDAQKVTRKAGAKRDPHTGEMVPFTKAISRLKLRHLLHLINGTYVALGKHDSRVAMVQFDERGTLLRNERYDMGRTYIDAAIATDDGGFAIIARRGLQFIKFDAQGNITFKRDLSDHRHQIYNYTIAKTDNGYLIGSSIGKDAQMQLLQIDKEGHKIEVHRYAIEDARLHPEFLVKSPSDNYLLAVTTEIHEPWIVHAEANGIIEADINNPTKYRRSRPLLHNEIQSSSPMGDRLPAHTPIDKRLPSVIKTVVVKTRSFLGGAIRKMIPSKNGKKLYAITGATGFKIFEKDPTDQWRESASIRRTKSKLIIKPNYIGPKDGKPPKHGTPYDYDTPFDLRVNRAESVAYVSDAVHGFYAVDITESEHPKVLYTVPGLKLHAFVLSTDERAILFYGEGRLQQLSLRALQEKRDTLSLIDGDGRRSMAVLENGKKIAVSDRNFIMLYESRTCKLIGQQNISTGAYISKLHSDGRRHIVVKSARGEMTLFGLDKDDLFEQITTVHHAKYVNDMVLLPEKKQLCVADDEGILCLSYRDPLNPKPSVRYRNAALNGVNALTTDAVEHQLIIAFFHESLGDASINP